MESGVTFGLVSVKREEPVAVPLTGVRVQADLTGAGARVEVTQVYENRETNAVEAVYRFPLPESAAVTGFRARVGERVLTGSVEERDRAFDEYDRALEEGHGAFLLDEERPNIFTLSVGNLLPGGRAEITITYIETLETVGSEMRFRLPTTISPRYVPAGMGDEDGMPPGERVHPSYAGEVPYGLSLCVRVHGRDDLAAVECPTHSVRVSLDQDPVQVELTSHQTSMDRDFVLVVRRKAEFPSCAWVVEENGETFVQAELMFPENGPRSLPHEIVFLLDCSGSMTGSSIAQAKTALRILLRALPHEVQTNIYRFGSTYEAAWAAPRPADPAAVEELLAWLERVDADLGGTEILPTFQEIVERPLPEGCRRDVLLLTDGQVANEQEVAAIARRFPGRVRVFPVGIGYGPNDFLIRETARVSGGTSAIVAPGERIEPRVLGLFGKVLGSAVTGLRIQGVPRLEQAPVEASGFGGVRVVLFGRCPAGAVDSELRITGRVEGESQAWVLPIVRLPAGKTPIPQLWARETIRDLEAGVGGGSRQIRRRDKAVRQQVIELSTRYGVVSSHTSLVAVETRAESERHSGEIVLRKVPALVTKGWHGIGLRQPPVMALSCIAESLTEVVFAPAALADRRPCRHDLEKLASSSRSLRHVGRKRRSATPGAWNDETLYLILDAQRPDGGFEVVPEIASRLRYDGSTLRRSAAAMAPSAGPSAEVALWTLIILEILQAHYGNRMDEWAAVVEKARRWVDELLRSLPESEAQALRRLAAESTLLPGG